MSSKIFVSSNGKDNENKTKSNNNNLSKYYLSNENLIQSNCDSKLSAFSDRMKNTHKENFIHQNMFNNFLESNNSENGNNKVISSDFPLNINEVENKHFDLENFFSEVHYDKDPKSRLTIYVKDKIVNSIDYKKIFILNNKNYFILQIPFVNGKTQYFRFDYGRPCIMKNYTIEITEDILKISIIIDDKSDDKNISYLQKFHRLVCLKYFFRYFKTLQNNNIIKSFAKVYYNKKLKKNIFNLLNLFYLIKIRENINHLKTKKFVLRKSLFIKNTTLLIKKKTEFDLNFKFRFLKLNFIIYVRKAKKLKETKLTKNFNLSKSLFLFKKFHIQKLKEYTIKRMITEVNKTKLRSNHIKISGYLHDFFKKKKVYMMIKNNLVILEKKLNSSIEIYKRKVKSNFFRKLLFNNLHMKRFYYNSNNYNYANHFFLFILVRRFINMNCSEVSNKSFSTIIKNDNSVNDNDSKEAIDESHLTWDEINKSNFEIVEHEKNLISSPILRRNIAFSQNCNFKLKTGFKNYIFSSYYKNNFHYPIIKNIFQALKENWKNNKKITLKFNSIVSKKILFNKNSNLEKVRHMKIRLYKHITIQRKINWNKFKMKLNQKKLQKIIIDKTDKKIYRFYLSHNFINFVNNIFKIRKIRKYFLLKKEFLSRKLLRNFFFQFLSNLFIKRKVEKSKISIPYNDNVRPIDYLQFKKIENYDQSKCNDFNLSLNEQQHKLFTRLISRKSFLREMNQNFLNFSRSLHLRLNYYKLIINCKQEKIFIRKTQKFRDIGLHVYKKYATKLFNILFEIKIKKFLQKINLRRFFNNIKCGNKIKQLAIAVRESRLEKIKRMSFYILQQYYKSKIQKNRKKTFAEQALTSIFYKYNYENYFLRYAEILKLQKYLANKIKKYTIKQAFKSLKQNCLHKKITALGKKYLISKICMLSLILVKYKNKVDYLTHVFLIRMRKFFFRIIIRNLKKSNNSKKIYISKDEYLIYRQTSSMKNFLNKLFSSKSKNIISEKNKKIFYKKLFLLKLLKRYKKKDLQKSLRKKFYENLLYKKMISEYRQKRQNLVAYDIIRHSFKNAIIRKFLHIKLIIAQTRKLNFTLDKIFLRFKRTFLKYFLRLFKQLDKKTFIFNRIKRIRIKQFFDEINIRKQEEAFWINKEKKLKFKNFLKNFLSKILVSMLKNQKCNILKHKLTNYIFIKNFLTFRYQLKKNIKNKHIENKEQKMLNDGRSACFSKFFNCIKIKIKKNQLKEKSFIVYRKTILDIFFRLQQNQFIRSQKKIANKIKLQNILKSIYLLKFNVKNNFKKRLIKLKLETYKNKFSYLNNIQKFLVKIKKMISFKFNFRKTIINEKNQKIKLNTKKQFTSLKYNIDKYIMIDNLIKENAIKTLIKNIQSKISSKQISLNFSNNRKKKLIVNLIKIFIQKFKPKKEKFNYIKSQFNRIIAKKLLKIFIKLKNERILFTNTKGSILNMSSSNIHLNESILNYSDILKSKIKDFFVKIKKFALLKKAFNKFYDFKIPFECKIFIRKLKDLLGKFNRKKHFEYYFSIQNQLINYKFFFDRLRKSIESKKVFIYTKKRKVFDILKYNAQNEKELRVYLDEASMVN